VKDDDSDDITEEEQARAAQFARLVDEMKDGEPAPPALDAEDRELLEAAQLIASASAKEPAALSPRKKLGIVAGALSEFGKRGEIIPLPTAAPPLPEKYDLRPKIARRLGTWIGVAGLAAAVLFLFFTVRTPTAPVRIYPVGETSRPTDALVGRIERADADRASRRLDLIYADRLAGYRDLTYGGPR
jgi:hypothetical protein